MMLDTNSDTRGIIIVFFFFFLSCIHILLRRTVSRIGRVTGHVTFSAGKLRVSNLRSSAKTV